MYVCVCVCEIERERERERDRDRDRDRETDRQTVTWSFMPSQPVQLYQKESEREHMCECVYMHVSVALNVPTCLRVNLVVGTNNP